MIRSLSIFMLLVLCATPVFGINFSPTVLKVSAPQTVTYDFDGKELQIPVTVSGTNALAIFCVYTKDKASSISRVQNGYLGWHYVNNVDTSVYISSMSQLTIGKNTIKWNGKDDDGVMVPSGEYTYYIFSYDNVSAKTKVSQAITNQAMGGKQALILETDTEGNPLVNPLFYGRSGVNKWVIGYDPEDLTLLETTAHTLPEGYSTGPSLWVQPDNHSWVFLRVMNTEANINGLCKMLWVPNGESTIETAWGDGGMSMWPGKYSITNQSGAVSIGDNLYVSYADCFDLENAISYINIISLDGGEILGEIDLIDWWSDTESLARGARLTAGPGGIELRNNMLLLNSHGSCMRQLANPLADEEDFTVWINRNGDYILDKNSEESSAKPWACNDFAPGPFTYNLSPDDNFFSIAPCYDMGAVSFGLLAPDGDGIGYFAFSGETAQWKWFNMFVDYGSAYDGIYCDNQSSSTLDFGKEAIPGLFFIAHDSIKGVLTSNPVSVEEGTPAAFTVGQNVPNPFNPTTTIQFSIPEASHVMVDVFNVAGQKVDTIANEFMSAGSHSATWNASGFSAGIYFYTLRSGASTETRKMTLVK